MERLSDARHPSKITQLQFLKLLPLKTSARGQRVPSLAEHLSHQEKILEIQIPGLYPDLLNKNF